jgi:chromosome partitioning protein
MEKKPHVIVLGNEKGGTGKSTVAMHVIVHLLREGFKVGTIDVDARQGSLTRYVENRRNHVCQHQVSLPIPTHYALFRSTQDSVTAARAEEAAQVEECLATLKDNDFIVIDTPGSDTHLSQLVHSYADTLITPLNDSFVDLDMLVRVQPDSLSILRPSIYAEMVWEQKKQRAIRNGGSIDWIILRNRLSNIYAKNKEEMEKILKMLSKRIGFRSAAGFGERVIFRELFLSGMTLLDLRHIGHSLTLSHVAASQELRNLIDTLNLPALKKPEEEALSRAG